MFWIIPCTIKTYREDSIHLVSVIIFLKASIVVLCYTYLPHFQMHLCLYHFLLSKADLVSLSSAWGVCGWVGGCVCVCVCVCLCVCLWCVCVCVSVVCVCVCVCVTLGHWQPQQKPVLCPILQTIEKLSSHHLCFCFLNYCLLLFLTLPLFQHWAGPVSVCCKLQGYATHWVEGGGWGGHDLQEIVVFYVSKSLLISLWE